MTKDTPTVRALTWRAPVVMASWGVRKMRELLVIEVLRTVAFPDAIEATPCWILEMADPPPMLNFPAAVELATMAPEGSTIARETVDAKTPSVALPSPHQ